MTMHDSAGAAPATAPHGAGAEGPDRALAAPGEPRLPFCGDFDMRIGRDGTWYYRNSPIRRLPLVKLFASVLRREADGTYWLVTPYERGRIVVDDAPFVAVEVDRIGAGTDQVLRFRTNIDEEVDAGPDRPIRVANDPSTGAPSPYILVRPGLEARLLRPVFYHLVEFGEERKERHEGRRVDRYGVWSRATFFPLDSPPT